MKGAAALTALDCMLPQRTPFTMTELRSNISFMSSARSSVCFAVGFSSNSKCSVRTCPGLDPEWFLL